MKVVHHKTAPKDISLRQWLDESRLLEKEDQQQAIKEYKQIAISYPADEHAYNRLMILFRQLKQTKDELYWINKAIENFQNRIQKTGYRSNSAIARLSQVIGHSTGLLDKKGNALFLPEPLNKWQKRKILIQKKMLRSNT